MKHISPEIIKTELLKKGYTCARFAEEKGFNYSNFLAVLRRHCNGKKTCKIKSPLVLKMLKAVSDELGYSVNENIRAPTTYSFSSEFVYLALPKPQQQSYLKNWLLEEQGIIVTDFFCFNKNPTDKDILPFLKKGGTVVGRLSIDAVVNVINFGCRYLHICINKKILSVTNPADKLTLWEFLELNPQVKRPK